MTLRIKILIILIPLVVLPLLGLGWIAYDRLYKTTEESMFGQMNTLLNQVALSVQSQRNTAKANIHLFSGSSLISTYIFADEDSRYQLSLLPLMDLFASYHAAYPDYYEIRLLLPNGYEDARYAAPEVENRSEEEGNSDYFKRLNTSSKEVVSEYLRNPDNGEFSLFVTKKLYLLDPSVEDTSAAKPVLRGYLAITVTLDMLKQQAEKSSLGRTGYILFSDSKGNVIFAPENRNLEQLNMKQAMISAIADKPGMVSIGGKRVFSEWRKLDENLYVFANLPETELSAQGKFLAYIVSIIVLASILLTGGLIFILLNYLVIRPLRTFGKAAEVIGAGNLDVAIDIQSNDEIGLVARQFRKMAAGLKETGKEKDAAQADLKESARQLASLNLELEEKVQRRTKQLQDANDNLHQANEKLWRAQEQIEHLAESSPKALENVSVWSSLVAEDIARVLDAREISIWTVEEDHFVPLARGATDPISLPSVNQLSRNIVIDQNEVKVPVVGMTGEVYGLIVVSGNQTPWDDTQKRLVAGFANQLGGTLEMLSMRKKLAESETRRNSARDEMKERGITALQICPACKRCFDDSVTVCEVDQESLQSPFLLPYRIAERYRMVRLLGRGGVGAVLKAEDETLRRFVSLKIILQEVLGDPIMKMRVKREAYLIAEIRHPGIVSIHDFGELLDGSAYIVMEFLEGVDLGELLKKQGPGSPSQVATVLQQVADALRATHVLGVIHRDLKPANVFLVPSPSYFQIKLLDFGLAKSVTEDISLTMTGIIMGTPPYMPPEQIRGQLVDERSDLFSLAAVIYELLTGERAFDAENIPDVFTKILTENPPALSEKFPAAGVELDQLFLKAFAKDSEDRPKDLYQWAQQVSQLLSGIPSSKSGWNLQALY